MQMYNVKWQMIMAYSLSVKYKYRLWYTHSYISRVIEEK